VYFIEKYTANGDPDFAQINCVCKAIGGGNWDEGKKKCAKGFASCIKMGLKAPKSPK
jgi:hypothetical protein